MIRAVATAAREVPVQGLVIGDGPEGPSLQKLARELNAPISFTGRRDDVPELLSAADVEVTMSEIEGAPLAVIEAMACGLPVIASNATSHPEVVADGESGILVEPGQPQGAAQAIVDLTRNPARRAELSSGARSRAVEHFNSDAMLDRYESFLEEIVLQGTPRG
jgi:glycosyltransferase involved in cell wall biosynthesis